jgi:hypothetical protein
MSPRDIAISVKMLTSGSNGIVLIFHSCRRGGQDSGQEQNDDQTIIQYRGTVSSFSDTISVDVFESSCLAYITVFSQSISIGELQIKK